MLQFAQPAVLWALAGLAVPIFLHLVNRRPAVRWRFPSLRFLKAAPLPRQGRRRISDPFLLLLRLLLYTVLILLAAGPYWVDSPDEADAQSTGVLVIDLSSSMGGWGSIERARESSLEILAQNPQAPFALITFADGIINSIQPQSDHALLRQAIRGLQPTRFPARPDAALETSLSFTEQTGGDIYIISDFQKTAWENLASQAIGNNRIHFHPASDRPRHNAVLLSALSYLREDQQLDVLAQLRNDSPQTRSIPLRLQADGRTYEQSIEIDPWETLPVAFSIPLPRNPHGIISIAEDDAYKEDNQWHLYLGNPPPVRVLVLLASNPDPLAAEELFFIQTALETFTGAENTRFQVEFISANMAVPARLQSYDAVFIGNFTAVSGSLDYPALREFAANGGTVLSTLDSGSVQTLRALRDNNIISLRHGGQTGREMHLQLADNIGNLSPISRLSSIFSGDAARDLYLASLYRFVRLEGASAEKVLLRTESGDPLLIEQPLGLGRWMISALSFHSRASDLPLRNSFLPLIKELFLVAAPEGGGFVHTTCRSTVAEALDTINTEPADLDQPGLVLETTRPLIVNVDRAESDPETLQPDELQRQIQGRTATIRQSYATALPGISLWPWFAIAAFLIFIAEGLLGSALGNRQTAGNTAQREDNKK